MKQLHACALVIFILSMLVPAYGMPTVITGDSWAYKDSRGTTYNETVDAVTAYEGYLRNNTYAEVRTNRPYLNQINLSFVRTSSATGNVYNVSTWSYTMGGAPLVYSDYGGIPLFSLRDYQLGYDLTITFANGTVLRLNYSTPIIRPEVGVGNSSVWSCRNLYCVPFEDTFTSGDVGTQEVTYVWTTGVQTTEITTKYSLSKVNDTYYQLAYSKYLIIVRDTQASVVLNLFDENKAHINFWDGNALVQDSVSLLSGLQLASLAAFESASAMDLTYEPAYPVPVTIVQKTSFPFLSAATLATESPDFVLNLVRDDSESSDSIPSSEGTSEKSPLVGVLAGVMVVAVVSRANRRSLKVRG